MIHILTAFTKDLTEIISHTKSSIEYYVTKYPLKLHYHLIDSNYERPFSWYKIKAIRNLLDEIQNDDIVWWMDADTLIINHKINIYNLLQPHTDLYLSKDWHGPNFGVFLVRNTDYNKKILDKVWRMTDFIDHYWWEQAAFHHLIDNDIDSIQKHITYIPQQIINAYECSYYGDGCKECQIHRRKTLVMHMPGLDNSIRLKLIEKYNRY